MKQFLPWIQFILLITSVRSDYNETVDDTNPQIIYTTSPGMSGWLHNVAPGLSCIDNTLASSSSQNLSYSFRGTAIYIFSVIKTAGANISITLDDQTKVVSLAGPVEGTTSQIVWSSGQLDESAFHRINITHLAKDPNFISTDLHGTVWLTLDAFLVTHSGNKNDDPTPANASISGSPTTIVRPSLTGSTTVSTSTSTSQNQPSTSPKTIVGAVLGALALILLFIVGLILYRRRHRHSQPTTVNPTHPTPFYPSQNLPAGNEGEEGKYIFLPIGHLVDGQIYRVSAGERSEEQPPSYTKSRC